MMSPHYNLETKTVIKIGTDLILCLRISFLMMADRCIRGSNKFSNKKEKTTLKNIVILLNGFLTNTKSLSI